MGGHEDRAVGKALARCEDMPGSREFEQDVAEAMGRHGLTVCGLAYLSGGALCVTSLGSDRALTDVFARRLGVAMGSKEARAEVNAALGAPAPEGEPTVLEGEDMVAVSRRPESGPPGDEFARLLLNAIRRAGAAKGNFAVRLEEEVARGVQAWYFLEFMGGNPYGFLGAALVRGFGPADATKKSLTYAPAGDSRAVRVKDEFMVKVPEADRNRLLSYRDLVRLGVYKDEVPDGFVIHNAG